MTVREKRTDRRPVVLLAVVALMAALLALAACAPPEPQPPKTRALPDPTYDPTEWGKVYPQEYQDWQDTAKDRPQGSRYKRGGEGGAVHDKLSEYPFLAAMAKGIGFSVEFNEPRGHALAFTDQHEVDPARLKAGGVCLACKTPYYDRLRKEQGDKLYSMPYRDAVNLIPEKDRDLGVSCYDCHNPKDASLKYSTLMADALKRINAEDPQGAALENAVCGQCHSTYTIPKKAGKSVGLFMPWDGSEYASITVENIIKTIESDPANLEWTQELTGLKLGYIRHPEYELYTRGDIHFRNGVTCVDCHQPYKVRNEKKVSDHNVMSPLDDQMRACRPCHADMNEEGLREAVYHVQDNYIGELLNAGYALVSNEQLIRTVNESKIDTQAASVAADYKQALDAYRQAFYRVAYGAAENSVGFHNPPEAMRILADAQAYSQRADAILRTILADAGVDVPPEVDLQLLTYLENRGVRRLQFQPEEEFRDPRGTAEKLWEQNLKRLRTGVKTGGSSAATGAAESSPTTP